MDRRTCPICNAVNDAIKDDPSRKLILLDTHSGQQARAAVAAVAWIGDDAPQVPGASNIAETIAVGWAVTHDDVAKAGTSPIPQK